MAAVPLQRAVQMAKEGAVARKAAEQPFALLEDAAPGSVHVNRDMRWEPGRACLPVASSAASPPTQAGDASWTVDCDLRTCWTPEQARVAWVSYDLGTAQNVAAVSIVWYYLVAGECGFVIEGSTDGTRFDELDRGSMTGRGTQTVLRSFLPEVVRFVRIRFTPSEDHTAPSIYEVAVHGSALETARTQ